MFLFLYVRYSIFYKYICYIIVHIKALNTKSNIKSDALSLKSTTSVKAVCLYFFLPFSFWTIISAFTPAVPLRVSVLTQAHIRTEKRGNRVPVLVYLSAIHKSLVPPHPVAWIYGSTCERTHKHESLKGFMPPCTQTFHNIGCNIRFADGTHRLVRTRKKHAIPIVLTSLDIAESNETHNKPTQKPCGKTPTSIMIWWLYLSTTAHQHNHDDHHIVAKMLPNECTESIARNYVFIVTTERRTQNATVRNDRLVCRLAPCSFQLSSCVEYDEAIVGRWEIHAALLCSLWLPRSDENNRTFEDDSAYSPCCAIIL